MRRYDHPLVGAFEVSYVRVTLEEAPWLSLVRHFPEPGSEAQARLRKLVTLP
ncbi:hypothetical protein [Streptomyces sp. MMG1533]|uniref:MmyB family transcriptional regulator n=1 Tax=Streptomyces sp. MMG1533 TaxID=1415546 RepID=UPI000A9E2428|nr:hypothetical protein [Streptomyces sp. MMG1533]